MYVCCNHFVYEYIWWLFVLVQHIVLCSVLTVSSQYSLFLASFNLLLMSNKNTEVLYVSAYVPKLVQLFRNLVAI